MSEHISAREGFSLIEVIAAIMILSFGLLVMAASTGYVAAQMRSTAFDTERNLLRQKAVEQVRSTNFNNLQTQAWITSGLYSVRWRVTNTSSELKQVVIITRGPAYRASGDGAVRTTVQDSATITVMSPQ